MLLAALSTLQAEHDLDDSKVPGILADMVKKHPNLVKNGYGFPGRENAVPNSAIYTVLNGKLVAAHSGMRTGYCPSKSTG